MSLRPFQFLSKRDAEIFVISVLILYLELALIRWIGTEIRIFAYLGNLILVVCFFGVGRGCYASGQNASLNRLGVSLLVLILLVVNPTHSEEFDLKRVSLLLSGFEDSPVFAWKSDLDWIDVTMAFLLVGTVLFLVASTFVPLGRVLGQQLQEHRQPIRAYSVNIIGSLVGIWLFNGLCMASLPPAVWFAVAGLGVLLLTVLEHRNWLAAGLVLATATTIWLGHDREMRTIWSPYHKLTVSPAFIQEDERLTQQGYVVEVNSTFYQNMLDLSDSFMERHPAWLDQESAARCSYNLLFAFKPHIRRLLIVGAGAGNNAAAALRHGVEQVDCVEIDPQIYALGRELHPERPYDSPQVRVIVNDARAFFKQASEPYDMIWFGWLDSHTLGSSYNNLRLDHYVYTLESLTEAGRLLTDDGLLVLDFGLQRPWIADRLVKMVGEVFGQEPLVYALPHLDPNRGFGGGVTIIGGNRPVSPALITDSGLRSFVQSHRASNAGITAMTTDDWPYLYLQHRKIPKLHLLTSLAVIGVALTALRLGPGAGSRFNCHFFALGAAFLLLEVQTVSRATLLFGMTWVVNAIVISAVLVMILLANLVASLWPRFPQWAITVGLAVTIAALALVPLDWFNLMTGASKLLAASAFLTAPVFFAGLIFIRSFAACADRPRALGSNLIGALVGGLLESLSFVTGIRALALLVGLFYVLALWRRPRMAQSLHANGRQ